LLPFAELTESAARVAHRERARIGVDIEAQLGWEKDKEAFLRWREIVEAQDVVVHKLAMDEKHVRGFAVYRRGYGIVAINSNDDIRARIFTLFHEYAHILLHMGGISDQNRQQPVERWCNQFAANFLMPAEAFRQEHRRLFPNGEASDWAVARLAARFKVSKASAAVRFEELGIAEPGFYDRLKAEWDRGQVQRGGGGGGNDAIETDLGRFGTAHVTTIAHALERGVIDRLEAQYALDVPADHWPLLTVAAIERLRAYGPAR
jgi:Zn-dependent peptidase ImmA (M78 family)